MKKMIVGIFHPLINWCGGREFVVLKMIDALKKAFDIWKQAKFTQIAALIVIQFIGGFVITPLGFLIALNAAGGQPVWTESAWQYISSALVQSISLNPGFWLSSFATMFVGVIISTIIIGAIQKIAHDYDTTGTGNFSDTLKSLGPMLIPLAVIAVVMSIIIGIPAWFGAEAFNLTRDPTSEPLWTFSLFGGTSGYVELRSADILGMVVILLIFLLLSGPFFLAISAVVVDDAGNSGIIEGWKLYRRKFASTIVAMIIILVIGIIIGLLMFIPVRGIVLAEDNLAQIFGNIFLLMIAGFVIAFFLNNWIYTALYSFYQEIKGAEAVEA